MLQGVLGLKVLIISLTKLIKNSQDNRILHRKEIILMVDADLVLQITEDKNNKNYL
jgi:hypothetical protein